MMARETWRFANDGLRARLNGDYGRDKLEWMERYLASGLSVAQSKTDRVYVDLFAGPGLNIDRRSNAEYLGGALRAVQLIGNRSHGAPFTAAYLVNLDVDDHEALTARIDRLNQERQLRVPRHAIHLIQGDANVALRGILDRVHPMAWAFVFADIEETRQLPFTTVQTLRTYRGHQSVDFYTLFPIAMDLQRCLPYGKAPSPRVLEKVDAYFGTTDWREIYARRKTDAFGAVFRREMRALYERQLRQHWAEAGRTTEVWLNDGVLLYDMLFASSNAAAIRVAQGATKAEAREKNPDQPSLF